MLEVEDWTQNGQTIKRKGDARKVSALSDPGSTSRRSSHLVDPPSILPGPPQAEVEDSFSATQPPTSRLFPSRPRANSTPSAGPSSLSRLLAQAPPELPEESVQIITPSGDPPLKDTPSGDELSHNEHATAIATTTTPAVPTPIQQANSAPHAHSPHAPTPLRPGSRASRGSTSSRFSAARLPTLAAASTSPTIVKAVATTALTEHALESSITTSHETSSVVGPPSPVGSLTDGMSNFLSRRRTTSHHVPRSSPLASGFTGGPAQTATSTLANFARNWGFRRKRDDPAPQPVSETSTGQGVGEYQCRDDDVSASDLLRRF